MTSRPAAQKSTPEASSLPALPAHNLPTIAEARAAFIAGDTTSSSLLEIALGNAARSEPVVGAWAHLDEDGSRSRALAADEELRRGATVGPLHGIPIAVKDMIDVAGLPTTAGSRVRADNVAVADAAVVESLRRAGAVIVGKSHTHEFAFGLTTPATRNPVDTTRTAGGSSGGSAAAVAGGTAVAALGTDTGGSIRVPASLTGVVGLKPSYGLVPVEGVVPLAWSLDHVGVLARTTADVAVVFDSISGQGPGVGSGAQIGRDLHGIRVGVPRNYFFERIAPDVAEATHRAIEILAARGATLVPVTVPSTDIVQAVQWGIMVAEANSYHHEGIRKHPELYGDDVRVLLEAGDHILASEYISALRARTLIIREWDELFTTIDLLAAPTTPHTAALAGQEHFTWEDGTVEAVSDAYVRLCAPANLTGRPAISVPSALDRAGLPIGFQLIGRPRDEETLLRAAAVVEHHQLASGTSGAHPR